MSNEGVKKNCQQPSFQMCLLKCLQHLKSLPILNPRGCYFMMENEAFQRWILSASERWMPRELIACD